MNPWLNTLTILIATGSALMGGTFFAFSTFIMPALNKLPASTAVASMQSINLVILRSAFIPLFMGTAATSAMLILLAARYWREQGVPFILLGSGLYLFGTFGITAALNVPLNDALARVTASNPDAQAAWTRYMDGWMPGNHARTAAAMAATASLFYGLWRASR